MYHTGVFIKGQSFIYTLDPRIKFAVVVCLSVFILWVKPLIVFVVGIALFCAVLASGIHLRIIGQALKPLLFFIILIFLVHALFNEGEALVRIPHLGLALSYTGLQQGFFVVWRFLCLIIAAVLLTLSTTPSQMIAAIKYFLRPLKILHVPVDDIAVMIMLALRFMPILLTEKEKIETAQKARGYNLRQSGFIMRIKAFLSLASVVLSGVFRRADELALAMEARNYRRGERTSLTELRFAFPDYFVLTFFGIFSVIFIALNYCFG